MITTNPPTSDCQILSQLGEALTVALNRFSLAEMGVFLAGELRTRAHSLRDTHGDRKAAASYYEAALAVEEALAAVCERTGI